MTEDPVTPVVKRRILVWVTAAAVALLAAAGFTLSFSSLIDLAALSGIDRQLAFLWPLIVDGFIVVATGAAFALNAQLARFDALADSIVADVRACGRRVAVL